MKSPRYYTACLLLAVAIFSGCAAQSEQPEAQSPLDWQTMPKIDVHTHYTYGRSYLIPLLDQWNMRVALVEVVTDPARPRWKPMVDHHRAFPEQMLLISSFDASRIDAPNFADEVIAQIQEDVRQGAIGVKVWKNIGLVHKDQQGNFIQIDDARFQPIWDYLAEEGIPVLAHIGEPRAAWMPLDEKNPHNDYYKNNPQYHFYKTPGQAPAWETVMAARDRWLEKNPDLVVIGAHLGSLAYDTDAVAERLDKYPNFTVELAERFGDLAIQPSEKVRDFFIKYQDRILYGTDLGTRQPAGELTEEQLQAEETDFVERRLRVHWDYLTRSDSVEFVRTGTPFRVMTKGLGLPQEVLEKVYHRNAERLLNLDDAPRQNS